MTRIVAIDPGPMTCGWVIYEGIENQWTITEAASDLGLDDVLHRLERESDQTVVVVEMVESYGMAVGREVFETCIVAGQILGVCLGRRSAHRMARKVVKHHLCHSLRATEAEIRQALIDRFGPGRDLAIGTKKSPGPLYPVKGHAWAALALAVAYADGCETYRYRSV